MSSIQNGKILLTRRAFTGGTMMMPGIVSLAVSAEAGAVPLDPAFDRRRWWTGQYRIVQTNLREIDALQDPREIARSVREFGANVLISNVGGIVAFYRTDLPLHYRNPYLKSDFAAEMLEAAHAEGIAYVSRYDLSKATGLAYRSHPEWFVTNRSGGPREYERTYQACPNGGWAQEYGFEILREGMTRHDADALFFNMVGYPISDYGNTWHGSCACENCATRFHAMYRRSLPKVDNFSDPNWADYVEFKHRTSRELTMKVRAFAAALRPGVPVTDWFNPDIIGRGEVQRRVDRSPPEWAYQAGEQSRRAKAKNSALPFSATSTAHIDYPWRQVTETAACHELRLAQMLATGSSLDLYLMGTLADQDDQGYLPPVSALYKWHAANAGHYAGLESVARVGLYVSESSERYGGATPWNRYSQGAFRGAYMALVDSRIPFSLVNGERVGEGAANLSARFDAIVMPHILCLSDAEAAALDRFVAAGGLLITTGGTGRYDLKGTKRALSVLESSPIDTFETPIDAHGWSLDDHGSALDFGAAKIPVDGHYFPGRSRAGAENLIPFAPDQRFGPPEFSYAVPNATRRSEPGVLAMAYGKGHAVHVPWLPEWQYYRDGLPMLQRLFAALIARYSPPARFELVGEGPVEFTVQAQPSSDSLLVHVVNYAGQRNGRYNTPPLLHGLRLGVRGIAGRKARALVAGKSLTATSTQQQAADKTWFDLPPVGTFEAIAIPLA